MRSGADYDEFVVAGQMCACVIMSSCNGQELFERLAEVKERSARRLCEHLQVRIGALCSPPVTQGIITHFMFRFGVHFATFLLQPNGTD